MQDFAKVSRRLASRDNRTLMFLHLPILDVGLWVNLLEKQNWQFVKRPITFVGTKPYGYEPKIKSLPLMNSGTCAS